MNDRVYVRFTPAVEIAEPDEAETTNGLIETMRSISDKTFADGGHAIRSVHAKTHGLLEGELIIPEGLPEHLRQGLFSAPGRYPLVMRFSTIPGDILDDSVSTPRGLAIKIIGIQGDRLDGSESDVTQDLVLVNGPASGASNAKKFLSTLKLLAATTDRAEGLKKVVSATLRGIQSAIIAATGDPSPTVATLGGQPETHILGDTFFSQAPLRFGEYIAKICAAPASAELTGLIDAPLNVNGVPDGLRQAVMEFFARQGGEWDVRAQLCTDLKKMPVEDASVVWPEDESPYQTVGKIVIKSQDAWNQARAEVVDDGMSFSPWHGIVAHRPLGSIMRVRKTVYDMGKRFRAEQNGRKIAEPREAVRFSN